MYTRTQAQKALDHLNGLQITPEHILNVKFTDGDSKRRHMSCGLGYPPINLYRYPIVVDQYYFSSPISFDALYVYGLGQRVSQSDLYSLFSQFGDVSRVDIIMDNKTGLSKGYGFVLMNKYDQAVRAISHLNHFPYNGRYLQVRFKNSRNNQNNY